MIRYDLDRITIVKRYQNKRQKLSDKDLEEIREMGESGKYSNFQIGSKFNVSGSHVGAILNNKRPRKKSDG